MNAVVIIPARYNSKRFPGKLLHRINGKPIIQYVYENALKSRLANDVCVATDSQIVIDAVKSFNGKAVLTSPEHKSGTNRIAEAISKIDDNFDVVINVQGDEPLIKPEMIDETIKLLLEDGRADIGTLMKKIHKKDEIFDPNIVKVVFDKDYYALYFSRAPIPFYRDEWAGFKQNQPFVKNPHVFKHIGIYSYNKAALLNFAKIKYSKLDEIEKLEQLCALENGFRIKVKETHFETIGVDIIDDLEKVKRLLK